VWGEFRRGDAVKTYGGGEGKETQYEKKRANVMFIPNEETAGTSKGGGIQINILPIDGGENDRQEKRRG